MSVIETVDVDVFVGNNTLIDPEVYQLWLNGYTAQEASSVLQKKGILKQFGATFDMLLSDTLDHYRTFSLLERLLQNPFKLSEQLTFQLMPDTQKMLIERYYTFNPIVIREILGKKLSSKHRKDLDDVSEKTKVPLKSCRRQFDNVKRVFKMVEEMMGSLVSNIQAHFLLSENLAKQYAAIVFITNNRFETSKKKLNYLTFQDFVYCAGRMITSWSYSSEECTAHEDMDVDLDREFLHDLRDLRVFTDRDFLDEHKSLVIRELQGKLSDRTSTDLENNFKTMSKNLIGMASALNRNRDLRDFFLDIVEKFIEPCRQGGWNQAELALFLQIYTDSCANMDSLVKFFPLSLQRVDSPSSRNNPQLLKLWERYMKTMAGCALQMYHS